MIILFIFFILGILYIFAIKGRRNSQKMQNLTKWDYAHRGLHDKNAGIPENSLAAFKAACDSGYGAELDVHILKDNSLAVIHDSSLLRTTGKEGNVEDLTHSELKNFFLEGTTETIPAFEDVLSIFEGHAPLIIELKTTGKNAARLCKAVCEVLDNYKGAFCIESFDPRCLVWLRRHRPQFLRGQLSQNFIKRPSGFGKIADFLLTSLFLNIFTRPDFIAYHHSDTKNISFRLATKIFKTQGAVWTVTKRSDYEKAKKEKYMVIFEGFKP